MGKLITDELINERLEARGFGEKQSENEEVVRQNVLNYYGVELTDNWTSKAEYYMYEETTKDGYTVYVATNNTNNISVCEDIYYYNNDLDEKLEEQIKYSNGDEDNPEIIYVDDLNQDFIDRAVENLFIYLAEKFEEDVVDELFNEGYNHKVVTPINALQYIEMISQDYQFDKDSKDYYGFINITVDNDYKWLNYATQVTKDRDRYEIVANHYGLSIDRVVSLGIDRVVKGELIFKELKDED
tara:strand:+ start:619 stop:1344 length:726 start_codon:yes stop_codon:yes gene_type:complete